MAGKENSTLNRTVRFPWRVIFRAIAIAAIFAIMTGPTAFAADNAVNNAGDTQRDEIGTMNAAGQDLFNKGKLKDAVAIWKRANELAERTMPGNSAHLDVLMNLSMAYYLSGDTHYPLVRTFLERVIDIDPNRWTAYLIMGNMCYEHDQPDCALGNFDLLLKLNPTYQRAQQVRKRIESFERTNPVASLDNDTAGKSPVKLALPLVIDSDMPNFNFYLTINEESFLTRIDIVRDDKQVIYQSIRYDVGDVACNTPFEPTEPIKAEDFNGDGLNDVKILCASGTAGGNRYLYYLFHSRNFLFMPFTGGALPDQARGQGSEEIRTYKITGAGGQAVADKIFKLSRGRVVVMKEADQKASMQ